VRFPAGYPIAVVSVLSLWRAALFESPVSLLFRIGALGSGGFGPLGLRGGFKQRVLRFDVRLCLPCVVSTPCVEIDKCPWEVD